MKRTFPVIVLVAAFLLAASAAQADLFVAPYGPGGTWKIYETVTTGASWANAQAAAQLKTDPLMGTVVTGNLVAIASAPENNFVRNITQGGGSWWTGGSDQAVEGEWRWISNGVQFSQGSTAVGGNYTNWNSGEPNNSGGIENSLEYAASTGKWNDNDGTKAFNYVIEYNTGLTALPASTGTKILNPVNGKYYELTPASQSWYTGKAFAESRSFQGVQGKLIQINDAAESAFAARLSTSAYIGVNDNPYYSPGESGNNPVTNWAWSGPVDPATGNFTYTTVASTGFNYWGSGEPNGGTGENFGQMRSDARWNDLNGTNAQPAIVEYDVAVPTNIVVKTVNGASMGTGIGDIQNLVNGQSTRTGTAQGKFAAINFADPQNGGGGRIPYPTPFPNDTSADDNNFAVKAYATIVVPAAGDYTFAINHDDQAQIVIDRGSGAGAVYTTAAQTGEHFTTVNFPAAGKYNVYLSFAEIGGGARLELYAAPGSLSAYDSSFQLVGDSLNGGLATAPLRNIAVVEAFHVTDYKSSVAINNLAQADALIAGANLVSTASGTFRQVNFWDVDGGGGNGHFGGDVSFLGNVVGTDDNDFATRVLGTIAVDQDSAGWWTFGISSDDGSRLLIDGTSVIAEASNDHFGSILLGPGEHTLDLTYFEHTGGAQFELFYAAGVYTSFNSSFDLLTADAVPEPATLTLALMGLAGLGRYVRRRRR